MAHQQSGIAISESVSQGDASVASALAATEEVLNVVAALRHPDTGCPWDIKQTHASLKPYLLEESYETLDAIDTYEKQPTKANTHALCDELGDVLLQVLLHARIAEEAGAFSFADVVRNLSEKLVRRHPHVFGEIGGVNSAEAVTQQWDAIKAKEKGTKDAAKSVLDGVPQSLPALMRATKLSKKAVKVGFAWPNDASLWACVTSELDEFSAETKANPQVPDRLEDELGDILFALTSLANHYKVDAEAALARANTKFTRRFNAMEAMATEPLESLSFDAWDDLWRSAKKAVMAADTNTTQ